MPSKQSTIDKAKQVFMKISAVVLLIFIGSSSGAKEIENVLFAESLVSAELGSKIDKSACAARDKNDKKNQHTEFV